MQINNSAAAAHMPHRLCRECRHSFVMQASSQTYCLPCLVELAAIALLREFGSVFDD